MSIDDYKDDREISTINKYMGNKNYKRNYYSEISAERIKNGDKDQHSLDVDTSVNAFQDIQKEIREIEETRPRYSSKEDISTLEYSKLEREEGEEGYEWDEEDNIQLQRNFISDVELDDLTEIMCRLGTRIEDEEEGDFGDGEIQELRKCMKSLVRIVHRFNYTKKNYIPVTETHQRRDALTIW